jgi:hypothetical protein
MSKFDGKTKSVTKKFDSTTSQQTSEPEIEVMPSGGNEDEMEEMMMQRMMENI